MLFWLYAPIVKYMKNFVNLCMMVLIHMDAHEYIFWLTVFVVCFYLALVSGVDQFSDCFGSDNIES